MNEVLIEGERRKSARHSLLSIYYDSRIFLENGIQHFYKVASSSTKSVSSSTNKNNIHVNDGNTQEIQSSLKDRFPIVANQRCGSWYCNPHSLYFTTNENTTAAPNTHFKSTDGHVNTYNFSLKRLNLRFLSTACQASQHLNGGATFIVDASKTKAQPDSFSRTLPIWCCVLNRLVLILKYQQEKNRRLLDDQDNDVPIHSSILFQLNHTNHFTYRISPLPNCLAHFFLILCLRNVTSGGGLKG